MVLNLLAKAQKHGLVSLIGNVGFDVDSKYKGLNWFLVSGAVPGH